MSGLRAVRAQVRRRLLISYRVDPGVARDLVPAPFRPRLVDGSAVAGICIIGLRSVRPRFIRSRIGFGSENMAHRIAVEWEERGQAQRGVYIFGRHSSALLPVLAGGRIFPGVHRPAQFDLDETADRFRVGMTAADARVVVDVHLGGPWTSALFPTVDAASEFYRGGGVGWSPRRDGRGAEPVRLTTQQWSVEPGRVDRMESSFFDGFPAGAASLDSVVVMRDLPVVFESPRIHPISLVTEAARRTPARSVR